MKSVYIDFVSVQKVWYVKESWFVGIMNELRELEKNFNSLIDSFDQSERKIKLDREAIFSSLSAKDDEYRLLVERFSSKYNSNNEVEKLANQFSKVEKNILSSEYSSTKMKDIYERLHKMLEINVEVEEKNSRRKEDD